MHILGISSLEHDPAAVLVDENGIIAAIEEGKLLRTRSSQGVPRNAINFCLEKARIQWKDLNIVAIGEGIQIRELHSIRFPNSLAWIYSQVTGLLGFRKRSEEHKTQWLSTTGEAVFLDLFLELIHRTGGKIPWPRINARFFRRGFAGEVAFST